MAAHALLKNELMEDEKRYNLKRWINLCGFMVFTMRHFMLSNLALCFHDFSVKHCDHLP